MTIDALTQAVKQLALAEGADLVGIAPVSRYEGAPRMLKPQAHLPEARSVVVMAVHHPDASVEWGGEPNSNYPGPFQIGMIPKLDTICLRVARFLEREGHTTVPLPCTYYWRHREHKDVPYCHAASFSHMNAFVAAGLGEYGWHGMVMSPKYGPRQRIISLITAAELAPDPLYDGEPLCDHCGQCERACWGNNYEKRHLLDPETIRFEIEGKTFEYANVNRWRCFWGEQCHLDMQCLAEEENLAEEGIYAAMDRGVERIAEGAAGYMCASFKHCMAKPVRRWQKKLSPGPRRKKPELKLAREELVAGIAERARLVGADRLAIQPLSAFGEIRDNIYQGFRTDAMFESFDHVVTIGRWIPALGELDETLVGQNRTPGHTIPIGQLMAGAMDIARFLDDNGCEAMQVWSQVKANPVAAALAGWQTSGGGWLAMQSVICRAPLPERVESLAKQLDGLPLAELPRVRERLPHCDLMGVVRLSDLEFPAADELRRLAPGARSLAVVGHGMPKRVVELAGQQEAECAMSFQYVSYQAMREAFWAAQDVADWLVGLGHEAMPLVDLVPGAVGRSAPYVSTLPDLREQSPFAAATGMGSIGRHGFLLTPEFGPRQRLAFVLTSAELSTVSHSTELPTCPEGCQRCAEACPVDALTVAGEEVFARQDARCEWSRSLGMVEAAGAGLSGWEVPDLPVPDALDAAAREAALAQKDPIQRRCYGRANHGDTIVERCLQACPL